MRFIAIVLLLISVPVLAAEGDSAPGLIGEYYAAPGPLGNFMNITGEKPDVAKIDKQVNFDEVNENFAGTGLSENFYARWTGTLTIEKAGKYNFFTASDDGSRLLIDGKMVVDNGGLHSNSEKEGSAELVAGDHALKIEFFQGGGGAACKALWEPPGGTKDAIPAKVLSHKKSDEHLVAPHGAAKVKAKAKAKLAGKIDPGRWTEQDYGPFTCATIGAGGDNWALKGVAVKLNKDKQASLCFDTELLRVSAGWTGGFIDGRATAFSGTHAPGPNAMGNLQFATHRDPGWARNGSFTDPREAKDGPLPRDWAKYKGLYLHGDNVIFSYTVGDANVLEMPGFESKDGVSIFTRTFNVDKSATPLILNVCDSDEAKGFVGAAGKESDANSGDAAATVATLTDKDSSVIAGLTGAPKGATWEVVGSSIHLKLPVLTEPAAFKLVIANIPNADTARFAAFLGGEAENLAPRLMGGPPHWNQPVVTRGSNSTECAKTLLARLEQVSAKLDGAPKADDLKLGPDAKFNIDALDAEARKAVEAYSKTADAQIKNNKIDAKDLAEKSKAASTALNAFLKHPYLIDTLTIPEDNPWKAWMRLGGLDFFADGKRAAVCTWSGDVWIVSGIDDKLEKLTWKRYATGLFQTLGLKIVDDTIYTLGRDQITRLHDLNGDGEADFYECFNNDCIVTTGFHEFTFDLQTDPEGNFYYAKGSPVNPGGRGFQRISAHNGTFIKVSKDGSKLEVIATGFRAPNGIGIGPYGEMTSGDNQGSWTPECPINLIKKGGFYGVVDSAHRAQVPTKRDNPICWMPYEDRGIHHPIDRSSGGQVWCLNDKWGPWKGHMLHLSYSSCILFEVMYEHVGEEVQGGVVAFPLYFASGVMRGRFNPLDGQLYLCGLKGWQTSAARDGILQRVRYTGAPVHMPSEFHVTHTGIDITFFNTLDPASAGDVNNYAGEQFNIQWTQAYGSDEYKPSDPKKKGRDPVTIRAVKVSPDGKSISLDIPDIHPVNNMIVKMKIKSADGTPISLDLCNTINIVP